MLRIVSSAVCLSAAAAFTQAPGSRLRSPRPAHTPAPLKPSAMPREDSEPWVFDPLHLSEGDALMGVVPERTPISAIAAISLLAVPEIASAKGGEYGLAEGRIISMAHPIVMGSCFLVALGSGFTGLQWRRLREVGDEIKGKKSELKISKGKLEALGEEPDVVRASPIRSSIESLQLEVDALTETRSSLAAANSRDNHYLLGTILLGLGTSFAIEGPVNTYMRAGKLFPGPHLYAGAGCVVSWALAASVVPHMQKGKEWARNAHIALNVGGVGLFAWQLPTGWEIMLKVIKNTKFP